MKELALDWIARYGYAGIFFLLVFGIVGAPVPDEWLLTFSGFLVFKGTLEFIPAVAAAFAGSASGISISYALGRIFGPWLLEKYAHWVHVTPTRLNEVNDWAQRWGRWALPIGYFVPVVRHLSAYFAGASRLNFRTFVIFAYSGAIVWSLTFVSAGYFLGEGWNRLSERISTESAVAAVIIVIVAALSILTRTLWRKR